MITFGCLRYMHSVITTQARLDAAKDDLINNMAHEFRTPVAILRSTKIISSIRKAWMSILPGCGKHWPTIPVLIS
jgi:signal transduction histidine kinase